MLGDKLKKLRMTRNLNQKEVAEAIGVSVGMVSKYESGLKNPSVDTLTKLADYYNVSIDFLKGNENQMSELEIEFPEGVQLLKKALNNLTQKDRTKMVKLMNVFIDDN